MTIITYRNGVMACDTGVFYDDVFVQSSVKVAKDYSGVLYGVSGYSGKCCQFISAIQKNAIEGDAVSLPMPVSTGEGSSDLQVLIAYPDGRLRVLDGDGETNHDGLEYMAIGSGMAVALGAMFAGASAIVAAEAAVYHSPHASGSVSFICFSGPSKESGFARATKGLRINDKTGFVRDANED